MDAGLVWIVLFLVTGVVLITGMVMRSLPRRREIPPEQLLKTRFANGEIGEEEYVRRLAVLQHDRLLELDD